MRFWRNWWQIVIFSIQHDPPQFVEYLMVSFAIALLVKQSLTPEWPYLVLSASLAAGAAVSMWVRVLIIPSRHSKIIKLLGVALIIYSFGVFAELAPYFP
ncbi:hypothetical protein AVDCRST_MAG92-4488 [uncultured Coleofasciculus sp.]|uniref:Uncharacterized protein n=1 Tax=uncultured Coleofasciculus sp. TaxID=1267456 RepID=A0A6J4K1Z7_9CYAN|nr:hypothetical protein AVDCRST_MAG92-4488 [uncultured Coleofasciculus sp.]